jgi:hypothetical protein
MNICSSQVAQSARPAMAQGLLMCGKCDEIDDKIAHHSLLLSRISDKIARDGIASLIEEVKTEKAALHPEPEKN